MVLPDDSGVDRPARQQVTDELHSRLGLLGAEAGASLVVHPPRCYTPSVQCWGFYTAHPGRCSMPLHAALAGALLACNHSGDSGTFQQAACSHPEVHSVSTALQLSEWDSIQLLLLLNVSLFSFDVKVNTVNVVVIFTCLFL